MKSKFNSVKKEFIILLFLTLCAIQTVMGACSNIDGENKMARTTIKEITYHFGDASVPPAYHRSYTVTVTADKLKVVVDSYGDILAEEEYSISSEKFDAVRRSFKKNRIRNCKLGEMNGCTGGTTESISCSDGHNKIFSGSVYHCGGKKTGNLCGDVSGFVEDIKNLAPDMEDLIQR
jgi:hypothetical protein